MMMLSLTAATMRRRMTGRMVPAAWVTAMVAASDLVPAAWVTAWVPAAAVVAASIARMGAIG